MRKNPIKILLTLLILVMAISLFVACGTPPPPPEGEETITLSQTSLTIEQRGSASLSAIVTPDNADKTVTWSSSDTSIATVNNGVVRGVKVGTAIITATTVGGKSATCTVTVVMNTGDVIPVNGVIVVPSTREYEIGDVGNTFNLTASVYPNHATFRNVDWSSEDESVATVTDDGIVTLTGGGSTRILATAHNGNYGFCTVVVKVPITVDFMYNGEKVGETTTYAADGGMITIPTQTAPTQQDKSYLAVPDISTVPTSLVYVESWYLDEAFTIPYVDGMDVSSSPVLYGKSADAYVYDIITAQDGNYAKITEFLPTTARAVTIPTSMDGHPVTAIGEGAFGGSTLTGLNIPKSVITISDDAFRDCTLLKSVDFEDGSLLIHIGNSAFRGCSSLKEISIPDSVEVIGSLALYGTDTDKATQLTLKGYTEKKYYAPKFVFEFLGEDVMPIGAYGEIKSNERTANGEIPAGVCDPVDGVGLEKALREFVEAGCNLMEANTLVNAVQGQDPTVARSYGQYFKILEEYGGMMLYRDMSLGGMKYEAYEGNAEAKYEKIPELYGPTANATLNSYINYLYPQFASFAGVLAKDEPGWVDWIDEFEDPYTFNTRVGNSGSSDLAVDADGNYIPETIARGRLDDGAKIWREYMPDKLMFTNLLQTYAPKWALPNGYYGFNDGGQLDGVPNFTGKNAPLPGEKDYEYYYRTYIENVNPQVFSYDYYPCAGSGTNLYNTHFEQLNYANYYSGEYYKEYYGTETGIPWWPMIQLVGWKGYRPGIGANEAEISWQINTALAYGAKGYTYFTYSALQSGAYGSAIDQYGNKQASYKVIQTVNGYTQAMAKWLLNAEVDHLKQYGQNPNRYDVNTNVNTTPEVTPARMLVPQDTSMNWRYASSIGVPHIVSHMKYYANNNYYADGVAGDVRELYFICNNTITNDGAIIINFSENVSGTYIHAGKEFRFSGNQIKLTLYAGEGAAILLDK